MIGQSDKCPLSRSYPYRRLPHPFVAFRFEFQRQILPPGGRDAPAAQHVDAVGDDVVEQALVVGDEDDRPLRTPQRVDAVRDVLERVDVEAGVGACEPR